MKKSFLLESILITMVALMLPLQSMAYNFMVNGLCYNINSDGTSVSVTYQNSSGSSYSNLIEDVVVPESVTYNGNTYTVTAIGKNAFYSCSGMKSIVIPNSVTRINEQAFYSCKGLTYFDFPESLTYIGKSCFSWCNNLRRVTFPNSLLYIGQYAFSSTDLTRIISYIEEPARVTLMDYALGGYSCELHVPKGTAMLYRQCEQWKDFYIIDDLPSSGGSGEPEYELSTDAVIFCTAHQPVEIPVRLKNTEEVKSFNIGVYVNGMTFTGVVPERVTTVCDVSSDYSPYLVVGERASGFSPVRGFGLYEEPTLAGGDVKMTGTTAMSGNDGEIFRLIMIPPKSGVYTSSDDIEAPTITLADGTTVTLEPLSFKIVAERIPGDLNDDGVVDENDQPGGGVELFAAGLDTQNLVTGTINEDTNIPLRIVSTADITDFSFTISLPEKIEMVDDVSSFVTLIDSNSGIELSGVENENGTITISGHTETPLSAGVLSILNLKVKTSWQNTYTIPVTNMTVTTADGTVKQLPDSETKLVMQGTRGDMNGDGRVDLSDALYIINLATGLAE